MKLKLARWLLTGPHALIYRVLNFIKFHYKIFAVKMQTGENYPHYVHSLYELRK